MKTYAYYDHGSKTAQKRWVVVLDGEDTAQLRAIDSAAGYPDDNCRCLARYYSLDSATNRLVVYQYWFWTSDDPEYPFSLESELDYSRNEWIPVQSADCDNPGVEITLRDIALLERALQDTLIAGCSDNLRRLIDCERTKLLCNLSTF
jgi:hypothetical protein